MDDRLKSLVLDMLEWMGPEPRPYTEVIEAWRTSCPRLTVWEDAVEEGLVSSAVVDGRGVLVSITPHGRALLAESGRVKGHGRAASARHPLSPLAGRGLG
ncbi:hypothetical protein [Hyphomicrobium sp. CS1BSMeth3]|uniref:hypothetical protein n=1 Tax=Hyphomicrobium sp. CS1BSMeth3 TaxID=1892844 RepID=UPI000930ADB9